MHRKVISHVFAQMPCRKLTYTKFEMESHLSGVIKCVMFNYCNQFKLQRLRSILCRLRICLFSRWVVDYRYREACHETYSV